MEEIVKKNWDRYKYFLISGVIITLFLVTTIVNKNEGKVEVKTTNIGKNNERNDLNIIKDFLISKIKSPFININYEIKKGDTIQKILKKYKVKNRDIQTVVTQYKKYSNPNNLLAGNKIDIIVEKNPLEDSSFLIKFSVPITKSTTILIVKNEEDKIVSKKIITKV